MRLLCCEYDDGLADGQVSGFGDCDVVAGGSVELLLHSVVYQVQMALFVLERHPSLIHPKERASSVFGRNFLTKVYVKSNNASEQRIVFHSCKVPLGILQGACHLRT